MTFLTRGEVDDLLGDYEIEQLIEIDEDGPTATGADKHWHLFHVVARSVDGGGSTDCRAALAVAEARVEELRRFLRDEIDARATSKGRTARSAHWGRV